MAAELRHPRAHCMARISAQFLQSMGQQCRGGSLAVHTGHANPAALLHQHGQQRRSSHHRNFQLLGQRQLGVVAPHGGTVSHKHRRRIAQLFRGVAFENNRAAFAQLMNLGVDLQVRADYAAP